MRFFSRRHPSADRVADFAGVTPDDADWTDPERRYVTEHLAHCQRCRDEVARIRDMTRALVGRPAPVLPAGLRDRVLASRRAGTRVILPHAPAQAARSMRRPWIAAAASLLLVVALGYTLRGSREAVAGATHGELTFMPALPQPGATVEVRYRAPAMLAADPALRLRARLRTPNDEGYNAGMSTHTLALLRRGPDGSYSGTMHLPDSVVFATFAVEDSAAVRVDDNNERLWELFTADRDRPDIPSFESLAQRIRDLMGRNWEEGHATARRMVALFPDDIRAWQSLSLFHIWLGLLSQDSIMAMHRAQHARFDAQLRAMPDLESDAMGRIFWYSRSIDSSAAEYWRERLLREAPTTTFAIQERLVRELRAVFTAGKPSPATFAVFDTLWRDAPADRRLQVADYAFGQARTTGDTLLIRQWHERILMDMPDTLAGERSAARRLSESSIPAFRAEGITLLRRAIARLDSLSDSDRPLGMDATGQQQRIARLRRGLLATLGRTLVAEGRHTEGLDVLRDASVDGWDLPVLSTAREASLMAGDTVRALAFAARVAADPRADSTAVAADAALAARTIGAAAWENARDAAGRDFVDRMLSSSPPRAVRNRIRLRTLDGDLHDMKTLADGRVTVVAIWSRFCGPAIDALQELDQVARRLESTGVQMIGVVEETEVSDALRTFLQEQRLTMRTYLDTFGEATSGFNSWGTPAYYVLDARGRVRFAATSSPSELLVRATAVQLETERGL